MTRKLKHGQYRPLVLVAFLLSLCQASQAQEAPRASPSATSGGEVTLFQNVRVFDGKSTALSGPRNVLVRGNKIERISTSPIPTDRSATTTLIDGGGRTLMPGLIDAHWHAMLIRVTPAESLGDVGYNNLVAGAEATDTLMRGFTTVRDWRTDVRSQARHRRAHRRRAAHFSVRRRHHGHEWARGFPPAHRSAADDRRPAQPHCERWLGAHTPSRKDRFPFPLCPLSDRTGRTRRLPSGGCRRAAGLLLSPQGAEGPETS